MLTLRAYDKPAPAEFVVAGGHGKAFMVGRGQFLTITDERGEQVGDFFAWNRHDPREYMSPHNTRLTANALVPPVGSRFVTNRRRPIFVHQPFSGRSCAVDEGDRLSERKCVLRSSS